MIRHFHSSLQGKLALAFAAALVPVLLLMLLAFRTDVRESEESVLDYQLLAAEAVAVQVEETFEAALGMAWAVANDPYTQTLEPQRLDAHLQRLLGRHPIVETIGVFDSKGLNRGWSSRFAGTEPRLDISKRNYFRTVMGTNGPVISEVVELTNPSEELAVVAAVPLRDPSDQVVGVVAVVLRAQQLAKWYEEARLRPGQAILVTDRAGRLAFHSTIRNLNLEQANLYLTFDPVRRALSGTSQTVAKFRSPLLGDERIGAFVPTRQYHWAVGVTMPREVALAPVHAALRRQLVGVLGTFLMSGIIATLMARQVTAPLSRLRSHAQAIGRGDLSHRVGVNTGDEFEELSDAFNEMAQQIQTRDTHLRASEERFRATFEQAAVGIAHTTVDGCWLWVNDRMCEILGYSRDELVEHTFQELTHPDDAARDVALVQELLSGRFEKYAVEKRWRSKDGRFIWINFTVTLARHPDGSPAYFIVVVEDIQRRKQMEEDRRQLLEREQTARANAEAANRAKDQLLATVSHELRTPLTPVLAALDLLEEEAIFSQGAKACLRMIRGNIEMEARLVSDLLDLTRIQQAKIELKREPVKTHDMLHLVGSFFQHDIEAKKLHLSYDLRAEKDLVSVDIGRMQQVFWNLLSNAVKYTPDDGRITIRTRNEGDQLRVEVADTGIGITPEVMERLFKAFEQGEQTRTRRYGGLGLGLTISKALVEMHGGKLSVSSDGEGKGATFSVDLPLLKAPSAEEPPTPEEKAPSRRWRILLVEDNPDTQQVLAKLLQKSGHVVDTASSAREALEAAQIKPHDLLVSDIGLPDASGWELLRELKKTQEIQAIAISGFGTPEDQEKSRAAGFACHLVKPINFQKLKEVIAQVAEQPVASTGQT